MRLIKYIFWLLIIGLIIFAIVKRHEVVSYLEQFTHGEEDTVSVSQTDSAAAKTKTGQPSANSAKEKTSKPKMDGTRERTSSTPQEDGLQNKKDKRQSSEGESQNTEGKLQNIEDGSPNKKSNPQNRVESTPPAAQKAPSDTNTAQKDLQDSARQAVKNGDYQAALKNYQEILEANPGQADTWGELGDMFHRMGDNQRAAQAYANAAIIFNQQGKQSLANKIIPYIERYSPELAEKIRNMR